MPGLVDGTRFNMPNISSIMDGASSPDLILIGFFVGNDTFDPNTDAGRLPTAIEGRRISRNAWPAREAKGLPLQS